MYVRDHSLKLSRAPPTQATELLPEALRSGRANVVAGRIDGLDHERRRDMEARFSENYHFH